VKDSGVNHEEPNGWRMVQSRTYDALGNIISWRRDIYVAGTIGLRNYLFVYDSLNRLIRMDEQDWDSASNGYLTTMWTSLEYTGSHRPYTSLIAARPNASYPGDTTAREYAALNAAGNPVKWCTLQLNINSGWDTVIVEGYDYNGYGHLSQSTQLYYSQNKPLSDTTVTHYYYQLYDNESGVAAPEGPAAFVSLSPNPAGDFFRLHFSKAPLSASVISIYDVRGILLQQCALPLKATADIPTDQLPAGYYTVLVAQAQGQQRLKLLIRK
jgi:hypothetical protein